MFKEMFTKGTITEGFFSKIKNKVRFMGNDLDEDRHYYEGNEKSGGLVGRLKITSYDEGENTLSYSRDDIKTGKTTTHNVTIDDWYKNMKNITGGWIEYNDDEQSRAFKFLQSIYKKDTKIELRHKTEYILNDVLMTYGSGEKLSIAKQKFNNKNNLVEFVGKTTDGDNIAFNPTEIKG